MTFHLSVSPPHVAFVGFFWVWYLEKADLHMYGQPRKQALCGAVFLESV